MLHWPLKCRANLDLDVLARPRIYEQLIKSWEEAYNENFYIKSSEQCRKNRPKNYFALGKGSPGNDIVDLESIRKEWMNRKKKSTGRVRKPVFADNFWRESFVEDRLERLDGTVDGTGHVVIHKAEYTVGTHTFRINTYYPCTGLSNRVVTFVLGFTWKGPTAFDVEEKVKSSKGNPIETDDGPNSLNSEYEVDTTQSGGKNENDKSEGKTDSTAEEPIGACSMSEVVTAECANDPEKKFENRENQCKSGEADGSVKKSNKKSRRQRKNSNKKSLRT